MHQMRFDRVDRPSHPRIVRRQEADRGDQQHGWRPAPPRRSARRTHSALASKPLAQTSRWISSRSARHFVERRLQAEFLRALDAAVERDPGHHLREDVVLGRAAALPDAAVGLIPDRRQMLEHRAFHRPGCRRRVRARPPAIDGRRRSVRHRRRAAIARARRCRSAPAARLRSPAASRPAIPAAGDGRRSST